jgi:hypothetical protein
MAGFRLGSGIRVSVGFESGKHIAYPELKTVYRYAASFIKEVGDMNKIEQLAAFLMNERSIRKESMD